LRAASALANLGTVGEKVAIHNALIKLIASTKSLDDRCEIAGMLDRIKDYKGAKLDDAGTAEPLFALARDVAQAEDKRARDFQNQYATTGGARPMSRYNLEGPGSATDQQETYPRRQVLARLTGLQVALAKVKPALPTETQAKVDAVIKAIDPAKTAAADKNTGELSLAAAIIDMAKAIRTAVPPPEKPAPEKEKASATPDKPPAAATPKP
jgi:hypothetical protein